jgi:hypothetical protein
LEGKGGEREGERELAFEIAGDQIAVRSEARVNRKWKNAKKGWEL